jgi:hypothetical protein
LQIIEKLLNVLKRQLAAKRLVKVIANAERLSARSYKYYSNPLVIHELIKSAV